MRKTKKLGFTLVELLVVIAIIAVLATVSIVGYTQFIKKADVSVDEQFVTQINTILEAEQAAGNKPAQVADAQAILKANGVNSFTATWDMNVFYWVGTENRVIIWTLNDKEDANMTGKVTFPKELAEQFADVTVPSADWDRLDLEHTVIEIEPEEGKTINQSLFEAVNALILNDTDASTVVQIPENTELYFTKSDFQKFYSATRDASGVGKDVTVDLNGGKIVGEDFAVSNNEYQFYVFPGGTLTLCNGTLDLKDGYAGFTVSDGASLVLRNITMNDASYASFFPAADASEIVFEGCHIVSNGYFGLMSNGLSSDHVNVVLKDTYFESNYSHGILLNVTSNLLVENSTVIAPLSAVTMRAGHAEIINSTLKAYDPDAGSYKWDEFTHYDTTYRYWGTGNAMPTGVLTLGDHSEGVGSYQGDVDCILTNVKFETADATEVPTVLLAARAQKNVVLNYDSKSNVGTYVLYDYPHEMGQGTVTVNGTALEFSEFVLPDIVQATFGAADRYTIPAEKGTFTAYLLYNVSDLDADVASDMRAHFESKGLTLTDAQWAAAKFAAGSVANVIKTIEYDRSLA